MRVVPVAVLMALVSSVAIAQTSSPPMAPPMAPAAAPAAPATAPAASPATAPSAETPAPTAAAPPAATPAPEGISRDDYIAKARDAAEKRAATRFDEMDANHDGVLTKDEIAAYRAAHRKKASEPQ
jgi:hypothetical protein